MKIRPLSVFLLIVSTVFVSAQDSASSRYGDYAFYRFFNSDVNGVEISWNGHSATSSLNSLMTSEYLFSDHFSERSKEEFIKDTRKDLNLDGGSEYSLKYFLGNDAGMFVGFEFQNQVYLKTSKDLALLSLFGNSRFAGKEIISSKNEFTRFQRINIVIGAQKSRDNWDVEFDVGLSMVLDQMDFKADELSVNTASDGEYLDIGMSNLSYQGPASGLDAIGIKLNVHYRYYISESLALGAKLEDLSYNAGLNNRTTYRADTSFRFEGLELNASDIFNGDLSNYPDSIYNQAVSKDSGSRIGGMLPSRFNLYIAKKINLNHSLQLNLGMNQWSVYGYHASLSHWYRAGSRVMLKTELGYGNFTGFFWTEFIDFKISNELELGVELFGLNSLIAPLKSSSYGASLVFFKVL